MEDQGRLGGELDQRAVLLLALPELLFHNLLGGDIQDPGKEPPEGAVGVGDRGGCNQRMDAGTTSVEKFTLKDFVHAPFPAPQAFLHGPDILFGNKRKDRHPDHIGDRVAEDISHLLVGKDRGPPRIDHPDTLVEVLDEEPVPVLALPQDLLHPPPLRSTGSAPVRADVDEPRSRERSFIHSPARAADTFFAVGRPQGAYKLNRLKTAGEERQDLLSARFFADPGHQVAADNKVRINPAGCVLVDIKKALKMPVDAGYPVLGADNEHPFVERIQDGGERGDIAMCEDVFVHRPGPPTLYFYRFFI
jgi:hypothetical protein